MNYGYLEKLAYLAKNGDEKAKENLIEEFNPYIINLYTSTFIDGYDRQDIKNECYKALFICLEKYDLNYHRFVAYATIGIKNHINGLIKKSLFRSEAEGYEALTLTDNLEDILVCKENVEEHILTKHENRKLYSALNNLSKDELELIDFVIIKENPVRTYAHWKHMCYSTATKKKRLVLNKLREQISR